MNFEDHSFDQFALKQTDRYTLELKSDDGAYPFTSLYLPTEVGWFVSRRRVALVRLLKWLMANNRIPRVHIEGKASSSITATLIPELGDHSGLTITWTLGPDPTAVASPKHN